MTRCRLRTKSRSLGKVRSDRRVSSSLARDSASPRPASTDTNRCIYAWVSGGDRAGSSSMVSAIRHNR